ncbi:peptidoglycan-binding domain-containing protein [Streptomyces sp. NPDC004542]|uniref:peptidoglycan-binding domain-containing protein n=1 Tax=Streptomyces sp. NPDC004542 TaxID=3154281 RepID=UPI0033B1F8AB
MSLISRAAVLTGAALLGGVLIAAAPAATAAPTVAPAAHAVPAVAPAGAASAHATSAETARSSVLPAAVHPCGYVQLVGYSCDYYYGYETIREWSSNTAAVKELQDIINVHTDYPTWLTVDGSFGPNTLAAVTWLQSHHHIAGGADGIVGPNTWMYLRT